MKKSYIYIALLFIVLTSCVKNPNVTEEIYLNTYNPTDSWISGLKRQLALTMNQLVIDFEMTSDNYFNNYTEYSKVFDQPQIVFSDLDVNRMQIQIGVLREMAEYGIEKVLPNDPEAKDTDWSYVYFSKAYALILAGENFVGLPDKSKGSALSSKDLLLKSLDFLDLALKKESDVDTQQVYELLKARVYRSLGDVKNAKLFATKVIGNNKLLFNVYFDGKNKVVNEMQNASFTATENRFAPLPRLDFLDPKYYNQAPAITDQKPIAIVKSEEAYLIMAEVFVAKNQLQQTKNTLISLLDVVANRPVVFIDDSRQLRNGTNRSDYPTTAVSVRFDKNSPFESGYVLNRQKGKIEIHTVSGTKVTSTDINNIKTSDDALYLIYRMRQEIFISEGRRSNDLGIKFPISRTEKQNNSNISDEYTKAIIPAFIPLNLGLDDFSVEKGTGNITITNDMNRILVSNKNSKLVLPFN